MASHNSYIHSTKPITMTRVPRAFLSLYCTGQPDRDISSNNCYYERIIKSYSIGLYERTINHYSCRAENTCENLVGESDCCDFIKQYIDGFNSVYIVCDGMQRTLTLINFWQLLDMGIVTLPGIKNRFGTPNSDDCSVRGYVAIGSNTEIMICRWGKCTLNIVSISNYGNVKLSDIHASVGNEWDAINCRLGEDHQSFPSAIDSQRAIAYWYRNMLSKWKESDCGVWKNTSSQLSHSLYRRKFLIAPSATCRTPIIDRIERASLFGGLAKVWYCGDVYTGESEELKYKDWYTPSPYRRQVQGIHRLDISSMYPHIMASYAMPGHCIFHDVTESLDCLKWACESDYIICAAVRLRTNCPEYPVRIHAHKEQVSVDTGTEYKSMIKHVQSTIEYGVGDFDTVLIGPELERAVADGLVIKLYEYAVYVKSFEYSDYMYYLIGQRQSYKISKDIYGEQFWKMLSNSFGGKLAQKNCGWITPKDDIPVELQWGEWYMYDVKHGVSRKFRSIAGYPQEWQDETFSPKGRPAVWSMTCSIGRYIMRCIRELMPDRSVIQQDTDGMYVTTDGFNALFDAGLLGEVGPGKLRLVSSHNHCRFYGPRHYVIDGKAVMSGLSTGFKPISNDKYIDTKYASVTYGKLLDAPQSVKSIVRMVSLHCDVLDIDIDQNGHVKPRKIGPQSYWPKFADDPTAHLFRGIN